MAEIEVESGKVGQRSGNTCDVRSEIWRDGRKTFLEDGEIDRERKR
jgi:hypothetical protein